MANSVQRKVWGNSGAIVGAGVFDSDRKRKPSTDSLTLDTPTLLPVDWTPTVVDSDFADGAFFPPPRLRERKDRLDLFDRVLRGDLSDFTTHQPNVLELPARTMIETYSAVVTAVEPEVPEQYMKAVTDAISVGCWELLSTGRVWLVRIGDLLAAWEPRRTYATEDGRLFNLYPRVSDTAQTTTPDRVVVTKIEAGAAQVWEQKYDNSGTFGRIVEGPFDAGSADYVTVDRGRVERGWGETVLSPDILALNAGIAMLRSRLHAAAIEFVVPQRFLPVKVRDTAALTGVESNQLAEQAQAMAGQAKDMSGVSTGWWPGDFAPPFLLEVGGSGMAAGMAALEAMRDAFAEATGIPAAVLRGDIEPISGVALSRTMFKLAAVTRGCHNLLHSGLQSLLGDFDWPYSLDLAEGDDMQDEPEPEFNDDESATIV